MTEEITSSAATSRDGAGGLPAWRFPSVTEQRPELDRLHRAVYAFTAAERRLTWRYQVSGEAMSHGRLRALVFLMAEEEATPSQLAREAEVNPASITAMIEQLAAQGVIRRRRDGHDKRVWWISLTDKGRSEVAELKAQWDARFADAFAGTADWELEAASGVLERLAATFETVARREHDSR
jgi:DNA-binding MarR family transcriptional regulator